MVTRVQLVAEAREWVGTRYQHQAHIKGVATDCGGLVYGVAARFGLLPTNPTLLPGAELFTGYARQAYQGSLRRACGLLLTEINFEDAQLGDVVLMSFDGEPQHVAMLGDYPHGGFSIIHAYAPMRKVVEARLEETWQAKIVATYLIPGLE